MAVEVRDNPGQNRFEAYVDGELAGFTEYRSKPGLIAFIHTAVDSEFEGQGVGSELIREALDAARDRGLDVLPFCPFVNAYIEKHPQYLDLVPESRREAFGL
jgi:predicted GNAT family acetyltransferase